MAILCLDATCSGPELQDWLAGDWALLFSHPEDFQYQGLEYDRWLDILRDEFRARGVRPLALERSATPDAGWVNQLQLDARRISICLAAPASQALREELLALPPRFALILDGSLQRRGVLKYSAGRTTVSPLDLLASIDALRRTPVRRAA